MNTAPLLKSVFAAGFLALAAAGPHRLQAAPTAATPAPANARVSGKEYVLEHTSSFQPQPNNARNPFWPIGWVPSAAVAVMPTIDVKAEQFVVTTISLDAPALAVVNGKTRGVGDRIPVSPDGKEFVTVKGIVDGAVLLDYRGHELRATNSGGRK